ncbi:hypothetical protein [Streptomyces sp. NPDC005209]|uniref:hypothetical protein n=1 Tax=Streptomyces sp. NPDC005209 TaxID=3156715 RepID=UPI0033ADCF2D
MQHSRVVASLEVGEAGQQVLQHSEESPVGDRRAQNGEQHGHAASNDGDTFQFRASAVQAGKGQQQEATTVAAPALPSSISIVAIRRRTGWLTMLSASVVVKPTPVKAERA